MRGIKMFKLLIRLAILFSLTTCAEIGFADTKENKSLNTQEVVAEVIIQKYKFIPEVIEIKLGQTVKWINKEKRQYHSVWFEKLAEKESDYLFPEDVFSKTFDTPGEFEYRCGPHPEMIAKVIVK